MSDNHYKTKRVALGLGAMFGVLVILDSIPNPYGAYGSTDTFFYFALWPAIWATFEIGMAASAGAYIARINFAGPAAIFTVLIGLLVVLILQFIALPVEPVPYVEVLSRNAIGIALSIVGAVIGAEIGRWFYRRRIRTTPNAA